MEKKPLYVLDMFPYPSGDGLHVGHVEGYTATDIYSRYMRMRGHEVLHPMGWDAFGLPAENTAIKKQVHPRALVERNISRFRDQCDAMGYSYDWSHEINTTDPSYYKWTQWIFLKLFKMGLAYEADAPINWCPSCKTGLANEEVEGGVCERCGAAVEEKLMRQWMLRITKYADRLLEDLDGLDWPEGIKELQRNWIGRSEGVEISFPLFENGEEITVFTTRPDTLFGATYLVLAPEHPMVSKLRYKNKKEVDAYIQSSAKKTEQERTAEVKEKTGVCLEGISVKHPATGEPLPVWVADYVLASYGTGAVMAVPAHDDRDFAFAYTHDLPVKQVVLPKNAVYTVIEQSLPKDVIEKLSEFGDVNVLRKDAEWGRFFSVHVPIEDENGFLQMLEKNLRLDSPDGGAWYADSMGTTNMAVFPGMHFQAASRAGMQRFVEHGRKAGIPDDQLDVHPSAYVEEGILANSSQFDGQESEQAKESIIAFLEKEGKGKRSVRYKLRDWVFSRQRYWGEPIPLVHCDTCGVVPVPEKNLPVLLPEVEKYEPTGTGESPLAAIDDWVNTPCPRCGKPARRETNTMPQWAGSCWYFLRFLNPHNSEVPWEWEAVEKWMPVDLYVGGAEHAVLHLLYARFWVKALFDGGYIPIEEPFMTLRNQGMILGPDGQKMSKSRGNIISPDEIVGKYGADTLRLYEMFLGPLEADKPWDTDAISGPHKFLQRVMRLKEKTTDDGEISATSSLLHRLIKKVGDDIESLKFNTAIAEMMKFVNEAESIGITPDACDTFLTVLSPFAPQTAGTREEAWPDYDEELIQEDTVTIPVQINGRVRGDVTVPSDADEGLVRKAAERNEAIQKWLSGKTPRRVVFVPGRLINYVV